VKLLEKDFSLSIRAGFETTGLVPLCLERALSRLPKEASDETTAVQQQLINQLSRIRYNPPPTTQAKRPKKKEKLPPGAAYTCTVDQDEEGAVPARRSKGRRILHSDTSDTSDEEEVPTRQTRVKNKRLETSDTSSDSSSEEEEEEMPAVTSTIEFSDTSDEEEEMRNDVQKIVDSLRKKRQKEDVDKEADEILAAAAGGDGQQVCEQQVCEQQVYKPQSYIACVYQDKWYVGQVLEKEGEPEAEEGEQYVLVSFMQWTGSNSADLKWPSRLDILNVLRVGTSTVL
jgi:hypothetical protein